MEFEGRQIQRMDPDKIVRLGLGHVPEGREVFPFLTVAENLKMGAYLRRDRNGVADGSGTHLRLFPAPERTIHAAGRPALRRRAADAGDLAMPDEPAETDPAR